MWRDSKLSVLRNNFFKFTEFYLKNLSFLVDGGCHSLVFDISFEENEQGIESNCIKAIKYFESKE
jgi:hypothetical protein